MIAHRQTLDTGVLRPAADVPDYTVGRLYVPT